MWKMLLINAPILSVAICLFFLIARRKHLKEIEKFEAGPLESNDIFLSKLGIEKGTRAANFAIWFRMTLAELGCIPEEAVLCEYCIWEDFKKLPFYDSPDWLDFVFRLEVKFDMKISAEQAYKFFPYDKTVTVKEMALKMIEELNVD